jgi:rare lipoprotein A
MHLRWGLVATVWLCGVFSAASEELPVFQDQPAGTRISEVGNASWYGAEAHGQLTSDGEVFDERSLTAAHRTLPLPCYARVTNLRNGRSIVVRVNDRGPFVGGRILDVSKRVANLLQFTRVGAAKIRIDYLGMAPPTAGDELALLASLRPSAAKAPAVGVSVVARIVDSAKPSEPRSPWGELVTYPFLVRTAGP